MADYPQVALFGSMTGGWRQKYVMPVLDELGVTYFDPGGIPEWTPEAGAYEAEIMANVETIVMVFNTGSPSFGGLAETGWAALGAVQRGQTFILYVEQHYESRFPTLLKLLPSGRMWDKTLQHWATASRTLVQQHARSFDIETMHVVDDMEGALSALRERYGG